jgi:6-pyruvoyltetrahydropterin/6-carboxytetrahydropterin synthase
MARPGGKFGRLCREPVGQTRVLIPAGEISTVARHDFSTAPDNDGRRLAHTLPSILLRRRVAFSAGHAYWLSDHNYIVEASVRGVIDPADGMVVNIVDVDASLKRSVLGPLANKHLNYDVPHFANTTPTLENIARFVADAFSSDFRNPAATLERVVVWESPTLWATLALSDSETKPMLTLTRSLDFAAAHRLHAPTLSDEKNREIFGKCNNPNGHGHNYGVEVTVAGDPDPVTGMLVDLAKLDDLLETEIMARFDHKHLNDDTPDFAHVNPTSENLTIAIWNHLVGKIPAPARLARVVVKETDRNYFEYTGDES